MQLSRKSTPWKARHHVRARHFSATIAGSLLVTVLTFGAPSSATAQGMNDWLQRKYDILEQQGETERMRAETERMRAEAEVSQSKGRSYPSRRNASTGSQQYVVSTGIDSLAGMDVPTFRLGNGVVLRVTGDFHPDAPTTCIAFCP